MTERTLKERLLADATIRDCAVLERQACDGLQSVAYVVLNTTYVPKHIIDLVASYQHVDSLPVGIIPVKYLPLTPEGQLDELALGKMPLIDSSLLSDCESRLSDMTAVSGAAAVVQYDSTPHSVSPLSQWLTGWKFDVDMDEEVVAQNNSAHAQFKSEQDALSFGGILKQPIDAPKSLQDLFRIAAKEKDKGMHHVGDDGQQYFQSYPDLLIRAQRIMGGLRAKGLRPQDKVLFQLGDSDSFLSVFWGCVLGGFVPVPLSVSPIYTQDNSHIQRLFGAWKALDQPIVITNSTLVKEVEGVPQVLGESALSFDVIDIESLLSHEPDLNDYPSKGDDLALLFLTSGSTGVPKAVMQSHASLLSASTGLIQMHGLRKHDVTLNWMPLEHVGAIVFLVIMPVELLSTQIHVPTPLILKKPIVWLELVQQHSASISWAPNFAFSLINDCIENSEVEHWNLESMRVLVNAGEQVVANTVRRFLELLQAHGLPADALRPAFGMSETCSGITQSRGLTLDNINDDIVFVELGRPIPGASIRIVNEQGELVKEGISGRLQVNGPSVTSGYYGDPEKNKKVFTSDGWFETGDIGYLDEGRLVLTGRDKDDIVINGINIYSHEIEAVAEELDSIRTSFTVAAAVHVVSDTRDRLAIFFVPTYNDQFFIQNAIKELRKQIVRKMGVSPDYLIPLTAEDVPKTAIGKIQRGKLVTAFEDGFYDGILQRFGIKLENANSLPNWFHKRSWTVRQAFNDELDSYEGHYLVFMDNAGLGECLLTEWKDKGLSTVTRIEMGNAFQRHSSSHYTLEPNTPADYQRLFDCLKEDSVSVGRVLHLWNYTGQAVEGYIPTAGQELVNANVDRFLLLIQALKTSVAEQLQPLNMLCVVSNHAQALSSHPQLRVDVEKSPIPVMLATMAQEWSDITSRYVDFAGLCDPFEQAQQLSQELLQTSTEVEVVYHKEQRLIPRLESAFVDNELAVQSEFFKQQGLYVITGANGGLALALARDLLKRYQARVLLLSRKPLDADDLLILSDSENWQHQQVDICDSDALEAAIQSVESRWDCSTSGIFHLAGMYHTNSLIEETSSSLSEILAPKVLGCMAIDQVLRDRDNCSVVYYSSLNGFFGGASVGGFAAANRFMETFAHQQRANGYDVYCLHWSFWDEVGFNSSSDSKQALQAQGYLPLSTDQGLASLQVALRYQQRDVYIGLQSDHPLITPWLQVGTLPAQHLTAYFTAQPSADPSTFPETLQFTDRFGQVAECFCLPVIEMPLTAEKAIDYERLQSGDVYSSQVQSQPSSEVEQKIAEIWQDVLGLPKVNPQDNFFELGGHSLLLTQVQSRVQLEFGVALSIVDMFKYSSIASLASFLSEPLTQDSEASLKGIDHAQARQQKQLNTDTAIAVVGIACRFPGADDKNQFWSNLKNGVESVSFFTEEEVLASGVQPDLVKNPDYVKAGPILNEADCFDAEFFGYSAREAELMDPQQRVMLECAWEAMEDAGYNPLTYPGRIGMYAGAAMNSYLFNNIMPNRETLDSQDDMSVTTFDSMGGFRLMVDNDKDYLTTRVSYKLNLRGPSVNIQTACSTSLVAVHMAAQSLLAGECEMMLAGGISVQAPQKIGHLYQEGMIVTPDGHCRAFDADAAGTIFGSGSGLVVLKRLQDALDDGDNVYAVIKGSASSNDGGDKVGYAAPSGDGQASAVAEALAMANFDADSVDYIEAHGTGTVMGDPIEVSGLAQALQTGTDKTEYCGLGSVKTNIGHMQIASGIAGFIKTILSIQHQQIPPSLHFNQANPAINFPSSPFYVNTELRAWDSKGDTPRRAGVNSLGIGGANAHVFIEEMPNLEPVNNEQDRSHHVLTLSARNHKSLKALVGRYQHFMKADPAVELADICFTANTGREHFKHRVAIVFDTAERLQQQLESQDSDDANFLQGQASDIAKTAFLFTGQGSQYISMGRDLYESHAVFRELLDQCDTYLRDYLETPLLQVLFPQEEDDKELIHQTAYTQPALFALEYALAQIWIGWGVKPQAVMGHSLGEYVAACLAGVFSLEDGLKLVVHRARLMQALPQDGGMLAVFATEAKVKVAIASLVDHVSIAAQNGPENTVISGRSEDIERLTSEFSQQGIKTKTLNVSHAFHSPLMVSMLKDYAKIVAQVEINEPTIPVISNLTGTVADESITTVDYWLRHIRQSVRFADSVQYLKDEGFTQFVELGPNPVLSGMARQILGDESGLWVPSLSKDKPNWSTLLQGVAALHVNGQAIDWESFDRLYQRRRCSLPTYAFERKRHWIEAPSRQQAISGSARLHPLLDKKIISPLLPAMLYETFFHTANLPFLRDHLIYDQVVASGACHVSLVMGAVAQTLKTQTLVLDEILFPEALVVPNEGCTVQLAVTPDENGQASEFKLISFMLDQPEQLSIHATGKVGALTGSAPEVGRLDDIWTRCTTAITAKDFYATQATRHIHLGSTYQWIESIRRGDKEAFCLITLPESVQDAAAYQMHPGLVDSGFGLLVSSIDMAVEETFVPFSIERIVVHQPLHHYRLWGHAVVRPESDGNRLVGDIRLYDRDTHQVVAEFIGLEGRKASASIIKKIGQAQNFKDLFHKTGWQPQPLKTQGHSVGGHWLVFADTSGISNELVTRLTAEGATYTVLEAGDVDPLQGDAFSQLLAQEHKQHTLAGVVYGWAINDSHSLVDADYCCGAVLHLIQTLLQLGLEIPCYLLTQGAQNFADISIKPSQRALFGMGKVIRLEHPEIPCINVELSGTPEQSGRCLLDEMRVSDVEEEVLWHQGQRHVGRWEKSKVTQSKEPDIRADASYLISGGTGALGLLVADWLAKQGAQHIALLSRSDTCSAEAQIVIDELKSSGANVYRLQADVGDADGLNAVLDRAEIPEIRGVFHAAGVLDDGMMISQSWQRFQKVWQPKAAGAWNLHQYSQDKSLDHFVLFSSAASVLGNQGQSNYAAANSFLDGLAHYRHQQGLPALSINWGPWEQAGMAATMQSDQLAQQGLKPISSTLGIAVLAHLLESTTPQISVMQCDWSIYTAQFLQGRSFFAGFVNQSSASDQSNKPDLLNRLSQAPISEKRIVLHEFVSDTVCKLLGLSGPSDLFIDKPLMEQGLDSLLSVEVRNRLGKGINISLPVSLLFNYPTVLAVVDFLMQEMGLEDTDHNDDESESVSDVDYDYIDDLSDDELEKMINKELA